MRWRSARAPAFLRYTTWLVTPRRKRAWGQPPALTLKKKNRVVPLHDRNSPVTFGLPSLVYNTAPNSSVPTLALINRLHAFCISVFTRVPRAHPCICDRAAQHQTDISYMIPDNCCVWPLAGSNPTFASVRWSARDDSERRALCSLTRAMLL